MNPHPIVGAVATLSVADPAGCPRADLPDLAALSLQVRSWLDAFDATLAARDAGAVAGDGRRSA